MTISRMTRSARGAQLFGGTVMLLLLVVSSFMIGHVALKFAINAVDIIARHGAEQGIPILFRQMAIQAIVDFGAGINGSGARNLQSIIAFIAGLVASGLALVIYPLIWLSLARTALGWLKNGIWAFQEELLPEEFPGDWESPSGLVRQLSENQVPREDMAEADRFVLGANAPYTPAAIRPLQKALSGPVKQVIATGIKLAFWFVVSAGCVLAGYMQMLWSSGVSIVNPFSFFLEFGVPFLKPAVVWLAIALVFSLVAGVLDFRFARALTPKEKPQAQHALSTLRRRTVDNPPSQFLSIFRSEIRMIVEDVRFRAIGSDAGRDSFANHSNFELDILIEGASDQVQPYMLPAAKRRLYLSFAFMLTGAAILLIGLFPASLLSALAEERFSLSAFYTAPVWVVLVLAAGHTIYRYGQKSFQQAEKVLLQGWFKTPVVHLRLDGTVNTQTASAGKGLNDSLGVELQAQQSHFETTVTSACITSVASSLEAERTLWSFEANPQSQALEAQVLEALKAEGAEAQVSNVIATATEAAKLKTALTIKQDEAELNELLIETEKQRLALSGEGAVDE